MVDHPSAGLWFLVETGLADQFLPELPAMRLETRSDPPPQGRADAHDRRRRERHGRPGTVRRSTSRLDGDGFDFRITRLAALFHDIGKPRTRGYLEGKGTTFHHHDAVGARMTRKRMTACATRTTTSRKVSELVALHLRFHTYAMGWSDAAVRRYVRDAGELLERTQRAHPMRLHDAQREEGGPAVAADGRSRSAHRRAGGGRGTGGDPPRTRRQRRDGDPRRAARDGSIGEAMNFLLDVRLDEGLIGDDQIRQRLLDWWQSANRPDRLTSRSRRYPQSVRDARS